MESCFVCVTGRNLLFFFLNKDEMEVGEEIREEIKERENVSKMKSYLRLDGIRE